MSRTREQESEIKFRGIRFEGIIKFQGGPIFEEVIRF